MSQTTRPDIEKGTLPEWKAYRQFLRATTTRWLKKVDQRREDPDITNQSVTALGDELTLCQDKAGEETRDSEYDRKIGEMIEKLEDRATKLALANATLNITKAKSTDGDDSSSQQVLTIPVIQKSNKQAKIKPFNGCALSYHTFIRRFEAKYGSDPTLSHGDRFLIFEELVGTHGEEYLMNLTEDQAELATAKARMAQKYNNPIKIREEVFERLENLQAVKSEQLFSKLMDMVIACETLLSSLRNSGTDPATITNMFYSSFAAKFPYDTVKDCLTDNAHVRDVEQLIQYARTVAENAGKVYEAIGMSAKLETKKKSATTKVHMIDSSAVTSRHESPPVTHFNQRSPPISSPRQIVCNICSGVHRSIACFSYTAERRKVIAEARELCLHCLQLDHKTVECTSSYRCSNCGEPHSRVICIATPHSNASSSQQHSGNFHQHSRVHRNQQRTFTHSNQINPNPSTSINSTLSACHLSSFDTNKLLFKDSSTSGHDHIIANGGKTRYQTVMVHIGTKPARILLDNGSGRTFITEEFAKSAKLVVKCAQELVISGAIESKRNLVSTTMATGIMASWDKTSQQEMNFRVVKSFAFKSLPAFNRAQIDQYQRQGLNIQDISSDMVDQFPIMAIIGLEYYPALFGDEPLGDGLYYRNSVLGPIPYGVEMKEDEINTEGLYSVIPLSPNDDPIQDKCHFNCNPSLLSTQTKSGEFSTQLEREYLDEFIANNISFTEGRYSVQLPWLTPIRLGNNRLMAKRRLDWLSKKLKRNGQFEQYSTEMNKMITNFAEPIPPFPSGPNVNYLPHHGVRRDDKETTPLRLVLQGDAHNPGELSLNDNLFKGVAGWDLLTTLLKFRFGATAFVSDIEKAFLMIQVDIKDRDALRIWWYDESNRPSEYRFTVVPFGTSASPFLLMAVMTSHFRRYRDKYPTIVPLIESSFYVDDLIKATPKMSDEQLDETHHQVTSLMAEGGMKIRKWRTNHHEVDAKWAVDAAPTTKVLGHLYNLTSDTLSISFDMSLLDDPINTKRTWTRLVASIYDITGLSSPYVTSLRLFSRKLWSLKLDWDVVLSDELQAEASSLLSDISLLNEVRVNRNVLIDDDTSPDLHVYCDASGKAIGAVAYCLSRKKTQLLLSRSKLAREASTPELELDALFLAVGIIEYLFKIHAFNSVTVFSDSLPNLQRLLMNPNSMKPHVALRISKLKSKLAKVTTCTTYRHVESKTNIADVISRGCSMTKLIQNTNWWNGPPIATTTKFEETLLSSIQTFSPISTPQPTKCECIAFSSYHKTFTHYLACAKFIQKIKYKEMHPYRLATILMLKTIQQNHLDKEIAATRATKRVNKHSELRKHKCIIDKSGLLRLQTRLSSSISLTEDQITPTILPSRCYITKLIIQREHCRALHAGADRTLEFVRNRYFVVRGRAIAKSIRKQCTTCKWIQAPTGTVSFGSVPAFRLDQSSPPFTNIGIDIFGPLKVNMTTPGKRYGLIITCATTRAVHLEVMGDMTEQSVFRAMRRCFARFGYPSFIYSDNGSQLKSVRKRLLEHIENLRRIKPELQFRLSWELQSAISPWRGGFFERLIRSIKDALQSHTWRRSIDDEELRTVMMEVESNINDRPLFQINGEEISPSHFFAGKTLNRLPSLGNNDNRQIPHEGVMEAFRKSRRSTNAIWTAWRAQYLLQLESFHQNIYGKDPPNKLQEGDIVILKNNGSRESWTMGRIEKVYISADKVSRSFDVRTRDRSHMEVKKRSIQTLIPLECAFEQTVDSLPIQPFPTNMDANQEAHTLPDPPSLESDSED